MLAEIIPKTAGAEQEDHKYRHRCSNATYGEKCLRAQVYHALGIDQQPFPDRFSVVLNDSSWHEQLTADWIRKSGFKLHSEQIEVEPYKINGVVVKGKTDGILTDIESNDILYEHKAINHFTFQGYETGSLLPYDYVCQCVSYLVGLKKILGKIIPALLLIKNKNTSAYLEYHIEYDEQEDIAKVKLFKMAYDKNELGALIEVKEFFMEEVVARIKQRYEEIDKCVAGKLLPKRQYNLEDWHCQYCRFGKLCWQDYDKEMESRKEGVNVSDKDIISKCAEYRAAMDKINELDKIKDKLNQDLTVFMQNENIKNGTAGEYIIKLVIKERRNLNKDKIAPEIIAQATETRTYESLLVNKFKEKKTNKDKEA